MFLQSFSLLVKRIFVVATLISLASGVTWAGSYKVLHTFGQLANTPSSGLVLDAAGNAYGTTAKGGYNNAGTVYQLSPTTGFHIVYAFSGHPDGRTPQGNVVFDSAGNIYGTTVSGGAFTNCNSGLGCGTVFRLTPPKNGGLWTETVLYNFTGGVDGSSPQAGVILDAVGNLYGTTAFGGALGAGVIFQVMPSGNTWTENVLYTFTGGDGDGGFLQGGLIFDTDGNLHGMSGATVFELSPSGEQWVFNVIHAFNPKQGDGAGAAAGLTFDSTGNLYGTTTFGGEFGFGTVFELTNDSGTWTETILHSFASGRDGASPQASLTLDASGNLYGTTQQGGGQNNLGTVFKLQQDNGAWQELLFRFQPNQGGRPTTPLLLDSAGRIYGTAPGVVFRITP